MRALLLLVCLALLGGGVWLASREAPGGGAGSGPTPDAGGGEEGGAGAPGGRAEASAFVGSETCRTCHDHRHETWLRTAHAYSLREPTDEHVEGRFDGEPIRHRYFVATPIRRVRPGTGEVEFRIRVQGRDGRPDGDHKVTHIIGRSFEQAYLTTDESGAWRVLPICWSIERGEWDLTHAVLGDITGAANAVPDDYDTRERLFNDGCGQCHATNYDVGLVTRADAPSTFSSTYLEGAVACESCHGPGRDHVAWHEAERPLDESYGAPARLVHPEEDLDAKQVAATCGRCHYTHEWRYAIDADPLVGHEDIAVTLNMDRPGFFADGRLAGLQYHGTTQSQSPCYTVGKMSCLDCHSMHSGHEFAMKWKDGATEQQCLQCHQDVGEQGEQHTFHSPGTASCLDCHMPKHMTGVLHFMRDHSISVPEPALTAEYGSRAAPNACNECHTDQTAAWAREWKRRFWRPAPEKLVKNVGTVVQLRRERSRVPLERLAEMARDASNKSFFRHTAIAEIARRAGRRAAAAGLLRDFLDDPSTEIVQLACGALGVETDPRAVPALLRLTRHEVRTVRVEALYAAVRAGWRADGEPATHLLDVYADARRMLHRQRAFGTILMRIAMIADGLGLSDDMERTYIRMVRESGDSGWPPAMTELTHRRGRIRAGHGDFESALRHYRDARRDYGEPPPHLLALDSAAAVAGLGNTGNAAAIWRNLARDPSASDAIRAIARANLAAAGGDPDAAREQLRALVDELAQDPAKGELRARARTALARLG